MAALFVLKLLLVKNFKTHWRCKHQIAFECFMVLAMVVFALNIRRVSTKDFQFGRKNNIINYTSNLNLSSLSHIKYCNSAAKVYQCFSNVSSFRPKHRAEQIRVMYTPSGYWQNLLMKMVGKELDIKVSHGKLKNIRYKVEMHTILCGIVFHNDGFMMPKFLNYSLIFPDSFRQETGNTILDKYWKTRTMDIPFSQKTRTPKDTGIYYKEGFLTIQHQIFLKYMRLMFQYYRPDNYTGKDFPIEIRQMPFPKVESPVYAKVETTEWLESIFFVSFAIPLYNIAYVSLMNISNNTILKLVLPDHVTRVLHKHSRLHATTRSL